MIWRVFVLVLFCLCNIVLEAQSQGIKATPLDSLYASGNHELYFRVVRSNLAEQNENNDTLSIFKSYLRLLEGYQRLEVFPDSLSKYYKEGVEQAKKFGLSENEANFQLIWANSLVLQGKYTDALRQFQSLEPVVVSEDYEFLPFFYDGYARLLYYLKEYELAFEKLKKEASLFEQKEATANISAVYNNLGILYKARAEVDSSLYYHRKSLEINTELEDTLAMIQSFNNIGQTYESSGDMQSSSKYYERAFLLKPEWATESLISNYSNILIVKNQKEKANRLLLSVYETSAHALNKKIALEKLIALKKLEGDFKKALEYQELLMSISNKLLDETKVKELERLKIQYDIQRKEEAIGRLKEKTRTQETIISKNKSIVVAVLLVLLLSTIAFILYIKNKASKNAADQLLLEQRLLRSQMNPHFIFNALSNIQTDILKNNSEKANKYLVKFSKILRYNLENSNLQNVLLSQEIALIEDYIALQKLRISGNLSFSVTLCSEVEPEEIEIPSMLLQPIIENSVEHGLSGSKDGHITLEIEQKNENTIRCTVTDDGVGYSTTLGNEKTRKLSVSTSIIVERLAILSKGRSSQLTYEIRDWMENRTIVGTCVTIDLPMYERDV